VEAVRCDTWLRTCNVVIQDPLGRLAEGEVARNLEVVNLLAWLSLNSNVKPCSVLPLKEVVIKVEDDVCCRADIYINVAP